MKSDDFPLLSSQVLQGPEPVQSVLYPRAAPRGLGDRLRAVGFVPSATRTSSLLISTMCGFLAGALIFSLENTRIICVHSQMCV